MRVICNKCPVCDERGTVEMPIEAYEKYIQGELVQVAWPEGSIQARELLITGLHPKCFDLLFPREFTDDER